MGAFDHLIPSASKAGGGAFDHLIPGNDPSSGGVQDWEPSQQPTDPSVMEQVNRGINWLGTRGTKALAAFGSTTRRTCYAGCDRRFEEAG